MAKAACTTPETGGRVFRATLRPFEYLRAASIPDALELLAKHRGRAAILAGGTDVLVRMKMGRAAPDVVIDIKRIAALRGVRIAGAKSVAIGPLTTLAQIADSALLRRKLPMLPDTALLMASPQVRNRGTVGGNLANAAPSADMAPPLIALGASARVHSRRGAETIPLERFFLGPGQTVLGNDRLLGTITVPLPARDTRCVYRVHTVREAMDISIVSAAVLVEKRGKVIRKARVVLGAVAPVPLRVPDAEARLEGTDGNALAIAAAAEAAAEAARPISDVRGSAGYRREMVRVLVRRALEEVLA